MAETNGLKRTYWRVGIIAACFVIFGFVMDRVFVTRTDYNSHVVWSEERNSVLEELVRQNRALMDSVSVINRKLDGIDRKVSGW